MAWHLSDGLVSYAAAALGRTTDMAMIHLQCETGLWQYTRRTCRTSYLDLMSSALHAGARQRRPAHRKVWSVCALHPACAAKGLPQPHRKV